MFTFPSLACMPQEPFLVLLLIHIVCIDVCSKACHAKIKKIEEVFGNLYCNYLNSELFFWKMYNDPLPIFDVVFAPKHFFPVQVNTESSLEIAVTCPSMPLK